MKALLLFLLSTAAWATSVTVPINVTVTDQNCQAWTIQGTNITCTGSGPLPPPPGDWPPQCANRALDIPWNISPHRYLPDDYGGMAPEDVLVLRITPTTVTNGSNAFISGAEYQSSPSARIWTLSSSPCNFTPQQSRGAYNLVGSNSITAYFSVAQSENNSGYYPVLQVGKSYYLSVKNVPNSTCYGTGQCGLFFDYRKPSSP